MFQGGDWPDWSFVLVCNCAAGRQIRQLWGDGDRHHGLTAVANLTNCGYRGGSRRGGGPFQYGRGTGGTRAVLTIRAGRRVVRSGHELIGEAPTGGWLLTGYLDGLSRPARAPFGRPWPVESRYDKMSFIERTISLRTDRERTSELLTVSSSVWSPGGGGAIRRRRC